MYHTACLRRPGRIHRAGVVSTFFFLFFFLHSVCLGLPCFFFFFPFLIFFYSLGGWLGLLSFVINRAIVSSSFYQEAFDSAGRPLSSTQFLTPPPVTFLEKHLLSQIRSDPHPCNPAKETRLFPIKGKPPPQKKTTSLPH